MTRKADLIDRSALLADIAASVVFSGRTARNPEICGANKIIDRIKEAPTVDAVEVVRCRDCIMKDPPEKYGDLQCSVLGIPMKNDNFCSYGIRKNSIRKDGDGNG